MNLKLGVSRREITRLDRRKKKGESNETESADVAQLPEQIITNASRVL